MSSRAAKKPAARKSSRAARPRHAATLSLETLQLLALLLDRQQLNAGAGDFEQVALRVIAAKREVGEAIEAIAGPQARAVPAPEQAPAPAAG